jgi:hypothetical protein
MIVPPTPVPNTPPCRALSEGSTLGSIALCRTGQPLPIDPSAHLVLDCQPPQGWLVVVDRDGRLLGSISCRKGEIAVKKGLP